MPLTELSPNVRRHGSRTRTSRSQSKGLSSTRTTTSLAADAVQSMLRTTTETGDIGQFSFRPSRLLRSGSRIPAGNRRSGCFDSPLTPAFRYQRPRPAHARSHGSYGPRQMLSLPGFSRQDIVRSSLTSYTNNPRPRMRTALPYRAGSQGIPSPASGPHGFYSHRSLVTLRSQRDISSIASTSPYARRMGRMPARIPSPAWSEAHAYGQRAGFQYGRAASVGTAASSPVAFRRPSGMSGCYSEVNGSVNSFVRLPSPAVHPGSFPSGRSPFGSRTNTPVSMPLGQHNGIGGVVGGSTFGLARSPTGSTIPHYYDYSESFVEENCFSEDRDAPNTSLPFNMDQTIMENEAVPIFRRAQTPFGILPGSAFRPAELPGKLDEIPTEPAKQSPTLQTPLKAVTDIPSRRSSLAFSNQEEDPKTREETVSNFFTRTAPLSRKADSTYQTGAFKPATKLEPSKDNDQRRSSVASRKTCSSSASMTFFPNASRSPRDLRSLAARVHSPTPQEKPHHISGLGSILRNSRAQKDPSLDNAEYWQLPSLSFRPLSFVNCAQSSADRPKTAEIPSAPKEVEIVSPTPERPVSSQSRRRFKNILGLEDDPRIATSGIPRSYNSLNFGKLNKVVEMPESVFPARLSIPAYSPRKSTIMKGAEVSANFSGKAVAVGNSDQAANEIANPDRSTIDSLLDKHIECLGLEPESSEDAAGGVRDEPLVREAVRISCSESTVKRSSTIHNIPTAKWTRISTDSSANASSLASPERELLVPRKLFSKRIYNTAPSTSSRLISAHSLPTFTDTGPANSLAGRKPSSGWQTLASTDQGPHRDRLALRKDDKVQESLQITSWANEIETGPLSELPLSPTSSSFLSQETDGTGDWDDRRAIPRRVRNDLLKAQASQRRKMRIRLKMKRDSLSQSRLTSSEIAPDPDSFHTALTLPAAKECTLAELPAEDLPQYMSYRQPSVVTVPRPRTSPSDRSKVNKSPDIPHRWSSIVAIAPEVLRPSMDVRCKASVRTAHTHRSNTSLAEPLNSTRMSAQIPRSSYHTGLLAGPDLGAPLSSLNIDICPRYPDFTGANARPPLRATESLFSDDSSAVQDQRGSVRKRFHLHSLRGVLPSSPGATAVRNKTETLPSRRDSKQPPPIPRVATASQEQERDLYGTVGMSDFAYRKRRFLERLKDWWKRHEMKRKLGLNRKKSSKSLPRSVNRNGADGMIENQSGSARYA